MYKRLTIIVTFSILCLCLSVSISRAGPRSGKSCGDVLLDPTESRVARYWDGDVAYEKVSGNWLRPNELAPDSDPSDLFIGFTGNHTWVAYKGKRYDPGLYLMGLESKVSDFNYLQSGLILRIKGIPEEIGQNITKNLEHLDHERPTSCSAGACALLRRSGLEISGFNMTPSRFIKNLVKCGIATAEGGPLQINLYVLNSNEFPQIMQAMHGEDVAMVRQAMMPVIAWIGITSAVGTGVYKAGSYLFGP